MLHLAWWKKDRRKKTAMPLTLKLFWFLLMSPFLWLPKNNFQISFVQARGRRALPLSHGLHCHHCSHCRSTWKYDDNKWHRKCHGHLAPGLPGLLLLSGLDGRVDTGLGGSEIGLRCDISTILVGHVATLGRSSGWMHSPTLWVRCLRSRDRSS